MSSYNPTKLIVVDPNVFIAASENHYDSRQFLDLLWREHNYVAFVVDQSGEIEGDYSALLTTDIPEHVLAHLQRIYHRHEYEFTPVTVTFSPHDKAFLHGIQCDTPIEPHLLGAGGIMGDQANDRVWLVVAGDFTARNALWKARGVHDALKADAVRTHLYPQLEIYRVEDMLTALPHWSQRVRAALTYPHTERELHRVLREYQRNRGQAEEDGSIEFKLPGPREVTDLGEPYGLTPSIFDDVLEAACAFANRAGGTILIGVTDQGEPRGFLPSYKERTRITNLADFDQIVRDKLALIEPSILHSTEVATRYRAIPLSNDRIVLVINIDILDKNKRMNHYRRTVYVRDGASNTRAGRISE